MPPQQQYVYERGDGRRKHRWKHDEAGFEQHGSVRIGKCHRSIDDDEAQRLLDTGIPDPDPYRDPSAGVPPTLAYPQKIYNVYRGVPYVAVPTRPGKSYHGYPARGRMPPHIRKALCERAKRAKMLGEFKQWIKNHCR